MRLRRYHYLSTWFAAFLVIAFGMAIAAPPTLSFTVPIAIIWRRRLVKRYEISPAVLADLRRRELLRRLNA